MDSIQRNLFGKFPRAVGVTTPHYEDMELVQFIVHAEDELDAVIDYVEGRRSVYSTISHFEPVFNDEGFRGNKVVVDKVAYDFDTPAKAAPEADRRFDIMSLEQASDNQVFIKMQSSPDVREQVLGDPCADARRLAEASLAEGIPIVGVVSGFGIHAYQLYEPTSSRPGDKIGSTARKWITELNLGTADDLIIGDEQRVMRMPNVERTYEGKPTGVKQIPITGEEMRQITPEFIIEHWSSTREIPVPVQPRPRLRVEEDYIGPGYKQGLGQEKMRPIPEKNESRTYSEMMVKEVCIMPCVYERALGPNPPNDVRVKVGIMFLNAGFTINEITEIIAGLKWTDFDRKTTQYQLDKLRKSGKGDWSCRTMMAKGLCTRADEPISCPAYGYTGGNTPLNDEGGNRPR